uniref:Uncharacterized protein n=1 Tax=Rhizophora mucronata TaxID=61149 RepID=A0A2P2JK56_RHIMU
MGSCASVHNKGNPDSGIKMGMSFGSKKDKLMIPESPIKNKLSAVDLPAKTAFKDNGSKEEIFFDSQPWLESDCEDDFFSVNGDFTPSCGTTPVHHNFSVGTPQVHTIPLVDRPPLPEPSPTGKKRLSDLFRESLREDHDVNNPHLSSYQSSSEKMEVKPTVLDVLPKSANATPFVPGTNSVCSSERTANGGALKSTQCCLPSLMSCRSFSDRKKKLSPSVDVNGKP